MTNTKTPKLTPAQQAALALLEADGIVHAYNGVSRATARVLVTRGLAEWKSYTVRTWNNRHSGRNHSEADWSLVLSTQA